MTEKCGANCSINSFAIKNLNWIDTVGEREREREREITLWQPLYNWSYLKRCNNSRHVYHNTYTVYYHCSSFPYSIVIERHINSFGAKFQKLHISNFSILALKQS